MPSLTDLSPDSIVSYFVALLVPLLDAIVPAFPSETAVIALGVASGSGLGLGVVTLVALAALGAFAGDNLSYWLGRRFGPSVERRLLRGEKGRRSREWAERTLKSRGAMLIIVCRFIPGGRTAVTLTAGLVGYPRRSFVGATAAAALIWANYAFWIGRVGGVAFESNEWAALALGFGIAGSVALLVELVRRRVHRPAPAA
jgi:membrane protein DedA with SNARE-associated domain